MPTVTRYSRSSSISSSQQPQRNSQHLQDAGTWRRTASASPSRRSMPSGGNGVARTSMPAPQTSSAAARAPAQLASGALTPSQRLQRVPANPFPSGGAPAVVFQKRRGGVDTEALNQVVLTNVLGKSLAAGGSATPREAAITLLKSIGDARWLAYGSADSEYGTCLEVNQALLRQAPTCLRQLQQLQVITAAQAFACHLALPGVRDALRTIDSSPHPGGAHLREQVLLGMLGLAPRPDDPMQLLGEVLALVRTTVSRKDFRKELLPGAKQAVIEMFEAAPRFGLLDEDLFRDLRQFIPAHFADWDSESTARRDERISHEKRDREAANRRQQEEMNRDARRNEITRR
ncbi:MAG: hypothetical protein JWP52_410 [Rhizobacter sp.]|nr:hypothetical protein [Rhizobacter sp.]